MVYGRLKFIMKRSVLRKVRHLIVTSHQKRKKAEVGLVVGDLVWFGFGGIGVTMDVR